MKKISKILLALLMVLGELGLIVYSGPEPERLAQSAASLLNRFQLALEEKEETDPADSTAESLVPSESSEESPHKDRTDRESQAPTPPDSQPPESVPDEPDVPLITLEESLGYSQDVVIVHLAASSTEEDMYLVVRDDKGQNAQASFRVTLTGPDGRRTVVDTNGHGSTYVNRLTPGLYTLSCEPLDGFTQPDPITVRVKEKVAKKIIENITDVVDIKTNTEDTDKELQGDTGDKGSTEQQDISELNEKEPAEESRPEDSQPEESQGSEESRPSLPPIYSPEGNGARQDLSDGVYRFSIGPNGYLLLRGSDTESDVYPVLTEGFLSYGLRKTGTEEEPSEESVELIGLHGTPAESYEITLLEPEEPDPPSPPQNGWFEKEGKLYYYENGSPVTGYVKIDGKHYYFNSYGVKASGMGIDVSEWQRVSDWNAVRESGIDFVIIRIGGRGYGPAGTIYSDDRAVGYIKGAQAAGLKVGVYFFSAAVTTQEAVEEASYALTVLKQNGLKPDLPIYIDMEHSAEYPNGRADKLSREQHTLVAKAFCETVTNSGYEAGIYASKSFFLSELFYTEIDQYSIWLANWTSDYSMPSFSYHYDLWQFSSNASVGGISGRVDINVSF